MLNEVGQVRVIRANGPEPAASQGLRRRVERFVGSGGAFTPWWTSAIVEQCRELNGEIDVILGELVPYETAIGVQKLAKALSVPWVADLQDPWALDEMWLYPSVIQRLADQRRMRSTLRTAAAVVMNTPEASVRLQQSFPEFRDRRVVSITNGFDAEDFEQRPPPRTDGIFRIVHSGHLHTDTGIRHRKTRHLRRVLGGMPISSVDLLTRSHVFLLQAVESVLRTDPVLRGRVEVHLVGATSQADRAAAAQYPFVVFHGYRSHGETISLLQTADLLFFPMQDLAPGVRSGIVPGKAYEYMASGVPILAAVPDGDVRAMLASVGTATICRPADVEGMTTALRGHIDAWRTGAPPAQADPVALAQFERRHLTAELAAVLRDVADIEPS
jgi:glycosyltransferase involved in cell wall biosynthesis